VSDEFIQIKKTLESGFLQS